MRRNKAVLTAGALVVLALVMGIIGSTWQAIEATVARDAESKARKQEREARRAGHGPAEQDQQRRLNQALTEVLVEVAGSTPGPSRRSRGHETLGVGCAR